MRQDAPRRGITGREHSDDLGGDLALERFADLLGSGGAAAASWSTTRVMLGLGMVGSKLSNFDACDANRCLTTFQSIFDACGQFIMAVL